MLNRRRKLLQYLRRSDFDSYTVLLVRLGLKDNYAKEVSRLPIEAQTHDTPHQCDRLLKLTLQDRLTRMYSKERGGQR